MKLKYYEVHCPFEYCEVYIVQGTSKKDAREKFENNKSDYECIGEVKSTVKQEILIKYSAGKTDAKR